jgi:hypothetical protein
MTERIGNGLTFTLKFADHRADPESDERQQRDPDGNPIYSITNRPVD